MNKRQKKKQLKKTSSRRLFLIDEGSSIYSGTQGKYAESLYDAKNVKTGNYTVTQSLSSTEKEQFKKRIQNTEFLKNNKKKRGKINWDNVI